MIINRLRLKERALKLRSKGLSYKEIIAKVPVAKSTISLWCRSVPLTDKQKKRLIKKSEQRGLAGIKAIQTIFWRKKCESFMEGVHSTQKLARRDHDFVAGLMIYWAEGTKNSTTAITNSDPRIIKFMAQWLSKFFEIKPHQLGMELQLHPGQNENKIKRYWCKITGIPKLNFRKTHIKSEGSGYRKNRLKYGVAKIFVKMNGSTYLLYKFLGAISGYLNLTIGERIRPEDWMRVLPYASLDFKK